MEISSVSVCCYVGIKHCDKSRKEKTMKILITGASGFIGSHLGNRLKDLGHDVRGYDTLENRCEQPLKFALETRPFQSLEDLSWFDVVIHLAAYINVDESIASPMRYFLNNAEGTAGLLELARNTHPHIKFIYASSAEVYGSARHMTIDEGHPLDPLSPYAVSKLAGEQWCKVYAQLYGMDITVIRNFNTFGEWQRGGMYGGVIAKFAQLAKRGQALPVYGSGEQTRDYMHVSQAVDGYVLAMNSSLPLIVNFGSGQEVKIIDIARHIGKRFQVGVKHEKSRPGELMRLQANVYRAKQYGYNVTTDFWGHLDKYLDHVAVS